MNLIKDALYYTSPGGASTERAQGVVVGVVSTLMAERNIDFAEALEVVKSLLPDDYLISCIPKTWREDL